MKKLFVSLLLLMTAAAAWAYDVTFVPTGVSSTAQPFTIEKEGLKIDFTYGVDNGSQFRIYKGQKMIIISEAGPITRIALECTAADNAQYGPGNFTTEPPGYSYGDKYGVWAGVSTSVVFTAVTAQVRVTKIVVTVESSGLISPIIQPASDTYYEPIEVTMSCYTQDATIHYTIDGSTPTINSTQYTAPFTLSSDATINAIATLDGEVSEVSIATYQFSNPDRRNCFEDWADEPDGIAMRFNAPIYALAQHSNYLFVKDQCDGYALIYGNTGQIYNTGDIIPEGFVVTKTTYNGEPEYKSPTNFQPATGNITIEPEEITADQVGHDLFGHYVVLHNVTIVQEGSTYYVIDENGNVVAVYPGWLGVPIPANLDIKYNLYAIVGSYGRENTIYQLLPVRIEPCATIGFTLCDLHDMPNGEVIVFNHEATVIYQTGKYLYLKDGECYGLAYGDTKQTYKTGDIIPPGWGGTKTVWSGEPELNNLTGFLPACGHEVLEPEVIRIPDVGHEIWAHYVRINMVRIDEVNQVLIDMDGNTCPYYPKLPFSVDLTKYYDVTGIITSYGNNTVYQFCFTDFVGIMPPPPDVCCFRDLKDISNETPVQFECPLTVIYQNGLYLYAKDSCGDYGLIYGDVGGSFINGDQIIGMATWTTYNGFIQLKPYDKWTKTGHNFPVNPIEYCVEDLSLDMCFQYIRLEDVKITFEEDGTAYIEDETGIILMYDKFNVPVSRYPSCDVNWDQEVNIADINATIDIILRGGSVYGPKRVSADDINPNRTYDVEGFLTVYKGQLEIYPTAIYYDYHYSYPYPKYGDVNGDGEVTIADVNCIIDFIINCNNY